LPFCCADDKITQSPGYRTNTKMADISDKKRKEAEEECVEKASTSTYVTFGLFVYEMSIN
jgi:hypothetical protein